MGINILLPVFIFTILKKVMETNTTLPKCLNLNHCDCFNPIINFIPQLQDANYIENSILWLNDYIEIIRLHIYKDLVKKTSYFKTIKVGLVLQAYKHLLKSIQYSENQIKLQNNLDAVIQVNSEVTIPLIVYTQTFTKWANVYTEMLMIFCRPNQNITLNQYIYTLQLHYDLLRGVKFSLDYKNNNLFQM
jgi:hypothetical protein